jgi:hypothetical protein
MKITWQGIITRHHLEITPEARAACAVGWSLMTKSDDPFHDVSHIARLLRDLHNWLQHQPNLRHKVDWSVLLTAICWHDTWKAQHFAFSPLSAVWAQWYEGIGSAHLFKQHANNVRLDAQFQHQVMYAIRKHSMIQFTQHETLESQLLWDLDALDLWSDHRSRTLHRYLQADTVWFSRPKLKVIEWMLRLHIPHMIYHDWPRGEFTQRRSQYFHRYQQLALKGKTWQKNN